MTKQQGRPLTPGEITLAAGMFGAAIDYAPVRIHRRRWWPLQPANVCMAPDGNLWLPPGDQWPRDFATASRSMKALFVHEMTHVWQAQRGGRWFLPLIRHPFCRYDYVFRPGKPFARYGIEQQAEIVRHVWLLRQGVPVPGKPPLTAYEGLLPFGPTFRTRSP